MQANLGDFELMSTILFHLKTWGTFNLNKLYMNIFTLFVSLKIMYTINSPIKAPIYFSQKWSVFHSVQQPLEAGNVTYLMIPLLLRPAPLVENLQYVHDVWYATCDMDRWANSSCIWDRIFCCGKLGMHFIASCRKLKKDIVTLWLNTTKLEFCKIHKTG